MRTTVSTDSVNPDSAGVAVVAFAAGGTVEALGAVGAGGAVDGHRSTQLRQRAPQPQRADPRLDDPRPDHRRRRDTHLRAIAQLNFANARRNPNAQTRGWTIPDPITDDDATNPLTEGRLRRFDCSQMTDGGAGLVLVSDAYLRDHRDARPIGRIDGWGHRTVGLGLRQKLDRVAQGDSAPYLLPHVRATVLDALRRARVTLDDLDGIEVHDCFTPSEYLAIDHIGLTGPGESWKAIENGEIEIGGRLPINPSGGLIGGGHPVGASGVRMLLDAAKQVSGIAGDYQVENAEAFGTLNFGGSTATTVSFVVSTTRGS